MSQAGCVNGRGPACPKEAAGWPTAPWGLTMTQPSSFPRPARHWRNSVFMWNTLVLNAVKIFDKVPQVPMAQDPL